MLTENDVSLRMMGLISDLDGGFTRESESIRESLDLPANSAVRCVQYEGRAAPIIEAYLELDVSAQYTLSFHLDVSFEAGAWVLSRSIQRDGITSEQIRDFGDLRTTDVEELRGLLRQAAREGFGEFERLTRKQMAA